MARNINIAVDCSDCCTCPEPQSLRWQSRSVSLAKMGFDEFGTPSTPPKKYFTATPAGYLSQNRYLLASCSGDICDAGGDRIRYERYDVSGASTYDATGVLTPSTWTQTVARCISPDSVTGGTFRLFVPNVLGGLNIGNCTSESHWATESLTPTVATWAHCGCTGAGRDFTGTVTQTLSDEYTTTLLLTYAATALSAASWSGSTPGSYRAVSTDELTANLRESRYQIPFKIPLVGSGLDYRVSWVERFIPAAGVPIDGIDVIFPGVYRPAVTIAAPPAGGVQATAIAVMSSTGTVSSIRVLNPGSGYATAPAVTVASAISGGTTSTGWTATLASNRVVSITGGSAGDYRAQLAFSSGGGSGATATCTVDETGGIATVTLTAPGSGYTSAPNLSITARSSGSTAAALHLHFGTETAKCAVWDGITPGGYDPLTPSTYPVLPSSATYYTVPMPTADGITLPANIVAVCDASACP